MATYKTEGFVLKKRPLGEADRLYSIFTLEHGKIEAKADGSAKITSKLAGDLEPFNFCQLMIANGKYFERLAGAKIINKFDSAAADWTTLILSWALSEGINNLTINYLPEPRLYQLLKEILANLFQPFEREEKIFQIIQFFWLAFLILGHRPKINFTEQFLYFDKMRGNYFETKANLSDKNYLIIPEKLVKILKEIDQYYQSKQNLYLPARLDKDLLKIFYSLFINHYQLLTNRQFYSFQYLAYV